MWSALRSPIGRLGSAMTFVLVLGFTASVAVADEGEEKKPEPTTQPEPKEKPDFPPFEEVSKDHELVAKESFFPLYYDKKRDHLLAVIPSGMLDKNFLLATSIAGGTRFTGYQWGHRVMQWQQREKKLILIEPELRYKMGEGAEVGDVIKRTYTDRIVLSTPIVSKKNGDPVIDLDKILKRDFANLGRIVGGSMNPGLSRWGDRKAFEKNVELEVEAAFMQGNEGGRRVLVHYSISELPETDYEPRRADDRIGYFLTAIKDWTRDHHDDTLFHRYIHRWHLRKEDPKAAVSDVKPEDQIIFYIEHTVPKKYRHYVREGILEWNKAFEKAGLRNAVAVIQQSDNPKHATRKLDPENVQYNFFRWIVSGRAFAMGPSRANPITGQILDADIIFDDSFVRSLMVQYARLSAKGPAAEDDPKLDAFLEQYPEWAFVPTVDRRLPGLNQVSGMSADWDTQCPEGLAVPNACSCNYAQGMVHEMCFANALFSAMGQGELRDEFVGEVLKEVVIHEVGHTLGLRHNFKASSWLPLEEILSNTDPDKPTCASVMDYTPALFAIDKDKQARFVTTTLGPYDYWAIEYGYRVKGPDDESEEAMLKKITDRVAEAGLDYATDYDTSAIGPDPLVNCFDHGSDPLAFARHRMDMVQKLQENIAEWAVDDGESYNRLRKTFDMLLYEYGRAARFASRVVGGQYVHRDHKGDPDARPPFEVVPVEKQREALDFLVETIFSDKAFQFDPELLNKLAPGRWFHWDSDALDFNQEYPIHDRIASIQAWPLFHVTSPFTITRIYDAELQTPADADAMTVPELMTKVTAAIWSELADIDRSKTWSDRKPLISSVRRNLQRRHAETLTRIVLSRPGRLMPADAHAVARMTLVGLSKQIGDVLDAHAKKIDAFSRAHLHDAKARIDKALDADFEL